MLRIARHHGFAAPADIPHDRPYADAKSREQWDTPIGSQSLLFAKIPDPWPAVRDLVALKRGSSGLEDLPGVRVRGPGPWAVVRVLCSGRFVALHARSSAFPLARSPESALSLSFVTHL